MSKNFPLWIFVLLTPLLSPAQSLPDMHDPVAIKEGGRYYVYSTGRGIGVISSSDLSEWKREPAVFDTPPQWAVEAVKGYRGHTWAPDIIKHNGKYYIYYSVSAFGKNTSCIGVAVAESIDPASPAYGWKDHGKVLQSYPFRDMWNAIDPNIIIDGEGTPWMSFGSFWDGIKMVKLDSNMLSLAQPEEWYSLCSRARLRKPNERDDNPGSGAVEAPFIFKKGEYYYLFVSYDFCCRGAKSDYKVVAGRSKSVTGPYLDRSGASMADGAAETVVAGNERFPGVGHCSVYNFDGKDIMLFHGYDETDGGRSKLLIRDIKWDSEGWPTVTL